MRILISSSASSISIQHLIHLHVDYCIKGNISFKKIDLNTFNIFGYFQLFLYQLKINSEFIFFGPLHFHILLLFFKRSKIFVFHDLGSLKKSKNYIYLKYLYSFIFKFYNLKVVSVSNQTRLELLEEFGLREVEVIYNPNRFEFSKYQIKKVGASNKVIKLLAFNQTQNKNFKYILDNLPKNSQIELEIIGLYNQNLFQEILKRKNLKHTFHSNISDEYLIQLYCNCHLFIFPSHYEGFGMPLIEAQHFGLPIIASKLTLFQTEIALDSVCYIDINKSIDLDLFIIKFIQNESFRFIHLGFNNAKRFSLENYFNKFEAIF